MGGLWLPLILLSPLVLSVEEESDPLIVIDYLAQLFGVDHFAAGFLLVMVGFVFAGCFILYVSYQSRLWERAHSKHSKEHPYFPTRQ